MAALLVAGPNDTTPSSAGRPTETLTPALKLKLVVGGLIAVAVLILILTIAYWRHTRPYDWDEVDDDNPDAATAPVPVARVASNLAPPPVPRDHPGEAPTRAPDKPVADSTAAFRAPPTGPVTHSVLEPAPIPIVTLEDLQRTSLSPPDLDPAPDATTAPPKTAAAGPAAAPAPSTGAEPPMGVSPPGP